MITTSKIKKLKKDKTKLIRTVAIAADKLSDKKRERNPQRAAAGLREDWFWTGSSIWRDGKICTDEPPYLLSYWATPIIILEFEDGEEEIECWMQADESAWDEDTNWPESARKILGV